MDGRRQKNVDWWRGTNSAQAVLADFLAGRRTDVDTVAAIIAGAGEPRVQNYESNFTRALQSLESRGLLARRQLRRKATWTLTEAGGREAQRLMATR